jgi:cysteine-rich repeat protein
MVRAALALAVLLGACRDDGCDADPPVDTDADTDVVAPPDSDAPDTEPVPDTPADTAGDTASTDAPPVDTELLPPWPDSGPTRIDTAIWGEPVDTSGGLPGDSDSDGARDTSVFTPAGAVGPLDAVWGADLPFDDFHRYAHDAAEGQGHLRAGSDRCTLPDGRALDRVWVSGGQEGLDWRYFDPTTHALVGAYQWGGAWYGWSGEDLRACSRRPLPDLLPSDCTHCGAHPGCTAFTLPPYDVDPVDAWPFDALPWPGADCPARCGDGEVQPEEACDDGNLVPGDGCDRHCRAEACGDGVLDDGEACDDGDREDGDGCSALCRVERCGDRQVQPALGEDCDDGNADDRDGCDHACHARVHGLVSTRLAVCGLADDGTPACFGDDAAVLATVPEQPFDRLVAGSSTVCGLKDGRATCWGDLSRVYGYFPATPYGPVKDLGPGVPAAAIDALGRLVVWNGRTPTITSGPWTRLATSVNGGCALDEVTGRAACFGICGGASCSPPAGTRLVSLDEADGNACGLTTEGAIVCWGRNDSYQGTSPSGTFVQVAVSWSTSCGLRPDGTATCWGRYGAGLPRGTRLREITLVEARGVPVGCGVDDAGVLSCWSLSAQGSRLPTHGW